MDKPHIRHREGYCSYCGKPRRGRWFWSLDGRSEQCDRLRCRLRTGHWLWMNYRRRLVWRPLFTSCWLTIRYPRLEPWNG